MYKNKLVFEGALSLLKYYKTPERMKKECNCRCEINFLECVLTKLGFNCRPWHWEDCLKYHYGFTVVDFDEDKFEAAFEAADKQELLGKFMEDWRRFDVYDIEHMISQRAYKIDYCSEYGFRHAIRIIKRAKGRVANDIMKALCDEIKRIDNEERPYARNARHEACLVECSIECDTANWFIYRMYNHYWGSTPIKEARKAIIRELRKQRRTPMFGM